MTSALDLALSLAASTAESGRGIRASAIGPRPAELLELYDMENCPYCRVVREALTDLDVDVLIYPCPKNGTRFRPLVERLGGKTQFPFLFDPNTDESLYESADIVAYLYAHYGNRPAAPWWRIKAINTGSSLLASATRTTAGIRARDSRDVAQPLELYSFEASPFARLVRERLTELEIPYIVRQMGRTRAQDWALPPIRAAVGMDYQPDQRNRRALLEQTGRVAVPYLVDPNTSKALFESTAILDYLEDTYAG